MKNDVADRLYAHYQRHDRQPPPWVRPSVLSPLMSADRVEGLSARLDALRLPVNPLEGAEADPLELLVVAAPKDFTVLPLCLAGAAANAGHPITSAILIVPESGVAEARAIVAASGLPGAVVQCEDEVLDESIRDGIRRAYDPRYGWVLQQLLCVAHVARSDAAGVLVLDADTVLTRSRVMLRGARQLLAVSLERHQPYYDFLVSLSPRFAGAQGSHVTHHMVQQPEVMRGVLDLVGHGDVESLADHVIAAADPAIPSAVSLDYEMYAQGLRILFPEREVPAKWSNAMAPRSVVGADPSLAGLTREFSGYYSVSLHDHV